MTLSTLIQKSGITKVATATPATVATQKTGTDKTVAEVATVAVAHSQNREVQTVTSVPARFQKNMADACHGLSISSDELYDALAGDDIGTINPDTLAAYARSLVQRREMDQGKRPAHYTEHATCKQCGPVWLWFSGEVMGCPWCWNRLAGRPIPRP